MFTGIVEGMGLVRKIDDREGTRRLSVETAELGPQLSVGDSVAVDGACLTVTRVDSAGFSVDVIGPTLARTVAGHYEDGSCVNLERAMKLGSRIDGHIVQGHVDGTGTLVRCIKEGESWLMDFQLPAEVAALTVERGSIAINGVSLTVSALLAPEVCRIGVIPFTFGHTNLGTLTPGAPVNVEGDLIGKYVGKVLTERAL